MAWEGEDKLNRKRDADFLSKLLDTMYVQQGRKSFVLAINAEWGAGKTFLLNNWAEDLSQDRAVVRFNAWENDYSDDPLVSFIAELSSQLEKEIPKYKASINKMKQAGMAMLSTFGEVALSAAAKHLVGMEAKEIKALFGDASIADINKAIEASTKKIFETHQRKKDAVGNFRKNLVAVVNEIEGHQHRVGPVIVLVDELDRCRPDFSVSLLESIKHIFDVPGVYFVIAINRGQLRESIKVLYGSGFDSTMYLKRFFDMEYTLVEPEFDIYTETLFMRYGINSYEKDLFCPGTMTPLRCFNWIAKAYDMQLRDRDQVALLASIVCSMIIGGGHKVYFPFALILIALKHYAHDTNVNAINSNVGIKSDELVILHTDLSDRNSPEHLRATVKQMFQAMKLFSQTDLARLDRPTGMSLLTLIIDNAKEMDEIGSRNMPPGDPRYASCHRYPKLIEQVGQINKT